MATSKAHPFHNLGEDPRDGGSERNSNMDFEFICTKRALLEETHISRGRGLPNLSNETKKGDGTCKPHTLVAARSMHMWQQGSAKVLEYIWITVWNEIQSPLN
jgi:hypothetical protein